MTALPTLLLFARAPAPGKVKTRLVPPLTEREALQLYLAFLEDAAANYPAPGRWRAVLEAEPDPDDSALASLFREPWVRRRQAAGDLGERLSSAFEREFAEGSPAAVAIGSDHPALEFRRIEEAFERVLQDDGAVVIPAEDGGYCAIGLKAGAPLRDLFSGIPWSSATVLERTLERLSGLGLRTAILETGYDVDRPEDLERLRRDLDRRDPAGRDYPRATARALQGLAVPAPGAP